MTSYYTTVSEFTLVELDGTSLAVREWGDPGDRPLVFWHSLGPAASGALVGEAAPVLARHGLHVLALDAPGFGESPALPSERYTVDSLVGLTLELLDALELERVAYMGHSWGGSIAVHLAARSPDRVGALVLLDSGHVDYADLPEVQAERPLEEWIAEAAQRPSRWESWDAFAEEVRSGSRRWTPEIEAALHAGLREDGDGAVASRASLETRGAAFWGLAPARQSETWPVIAAAGTPVLLLTATESAELREQNAEWGARFAAAVPQAEVRPVPDAGHSLLTDAGPELADAIGRWLEAAA